MYRVGTGAFALMLGAAGWVLSTATENVSLVGAGSFTAFALAGFGLMWRAWAKENARLTDRLNDANLRADKAEYREGIVMTAVRDHNARVGLEEGRCTGLAIPRAYWAWPPAQEAAR